MDNSEDKRRTRQDRELFWCWRDMGRVSWYKKNLMTGKKSRLGTGVINLASKL